MTISIGNSFKQICLAIYLIFSFRGLLNTPIEAVGYAIEVLLAVGAVVFFFIYFVDLAIKRELKPVHFLGVIVCLLPIISTISAKLEFDQPLIYGLLSQRDYFLILTPYIILYLLEIKVISIQLLENTFVKVSWLFLIGFSLVVLLVDPAPYVTTGIVGFKELKGGYIFRFQMVFILFGAIYYLVKWLDKNKLIYFIYALMFISYVVLIRQDRTIVFFLVITLAILLMKRLPLKKIINFLIIAGIILFYFVTYGFLAEHEGVTQINKLYYQTYLTLFGEEVPGQKVDVRWSELETAVKYIEKNPIWGSGELSKKWNGGFERFGHFYPSDIGIFGVLFIYGIGGFLIACSQIIYFVNLNRKVKSKQYIFMSSLKYSILMFYLNSFSDGSLMQRTAIGMTMILIFYYYYQSSKQQQNEIR